MHMIGLNSQFNNFPSILFYYLSDDLFQAVVYWPDQHLAPSLGAKDDVVQDMMHCLLLVNIFLVHVDDCITNNVFCQHIPSTQAPNKERRSHPPVETRGLSRAGSVNATFPDIYYRRYISRLEGLKALANEAQWDVWWAEGRALSQEQAI